MADVDISSSFLTLLQWLLSQFKRIINWFDHFYIFEGVSVLQFLLGLAIVSAVVTIVIVGVNFRNAGSYVGDKVNKFRSKE